MSPEAKLNSILDYLSSTVQSATEFTTTQAPLVAQEIVAWHFWSNLTILLFLVLGILGLSWVGVYALYQIIKKDDDDWSPIMLIAFAGAIILSLFGVGTGSEIVKNRVAPRIVVLDWVANRI